MSFPPQRGIRQGDIAISPYLFVLYLERLGHIINHTVHFGRWKPIQLSRHGHLLSHLFFADDLVLFAEASSDQMLVILECLDLFCSLSGQTVSLQKSNIGFSNGIKSKVASLISNLAKISHTYNLGKYLGVPSIHGRVTHHLFQQTLD